jgi:hypothetical protein
MGRGESGRRCGLTSRVEKVYFKTWTGDQNGYPPNGGGGGLGCKSSSSSTLVLLRPSFYLYLCKSDILTSSPQVASNMSFTSLSTTSLTGPAIAISQCTRFSGAPGVGNCTNSQFQIRDITLDGLRGTTQSADVASFQCSAVAPCTDIGLFDVDLKFVNGSVVDDYLCGNVEDPRGWACNGAVCVGSSATGGC